MYTSLEKIQAYLNREITPNELLYLEDSIDNVTQYIKSYTGRNWLENLDYVQEEERLYDGNGKRELFIEDFANLTTLQFLDDFGNVYETIPSTDYELYPLNEEIKESIYIRYRVFPARRANIKIVAEFHSGALPPAVRAVATALVAEFLSSQKAITAPFDSEAIEGYSYRIGSGQGTESDKKMVSLISRLDGYRKISV